MKKLYSDLNAVSLSVLKENTPSYGVLKKDSKAMDSSLITIIYDKKKDKPIAFNAMPLLDVDLGGHKKNVLHLGLVMVDPSAQSKGLSSMLYGFSCVLLFLKNKMRPIWISSVTQVPAVVGLVAELYSGIYPGYEGSRRSFEHKLIANEIMRSHRHAFGVGKEADFDCETFIIKNAYTGGSDALKKTFENAPKHRKCFYNSLCQKHLDYLRGDDFLQIGILDRPAIKNYILRMIPEGNFLGVITAFIFFIFKAILLPMVYWFDNKNEWEGLRPYKNE